MLLVCDKCYRQTTKCSKKSGARLSNQLSYQGSNVGISRFSEQTSKGTKVFLLCAFDFVSLQIPPRSQGILYRLGLFFCFWVCIV